MSQTTPTIPQVFKAGALGGVVAGVINTGVYFVGSALGAKYMGDDGKGGLELLAAYRPMMMSVIFSLVGTAILAGLLKVAPQKAWTIWLVLSVLWFLSAIPGPFLVIPNDMAASLALEAMHVVGAICVIGAIARVRRRALGG